jgi:amidohydrolase
VTLDDATPAWLVEFLDGHRDELVALRRQLHAHPEPSGEEHATTELVATRLEAAGLAPRVLASGTGLVCDVGAGSEPPVVALRADLDALSMDDDKDVPYRSRRPGVAHACGHDVHTAVVVGAGLALARLLREPADGRVRLVFEPAEERVPGGAVEVLAAGELDGVRQVFGLHCDPKLDVGTVGVRAGAITAAADQVDVHLHGPGGHTARPHLTVDLVAVAARVALELPALVRGSGDDDGLQLVFGSVTAGDAPNVIPTRATLRGSLRTPDRERWSAAGEVLERALEEIVGPTGARWELDHVRGVPPVVNHPASTEVLARAATSVLGPDGVVATPRSAGGDSFAWYLERCPGSYGRLGTHRPGDRERLDLHAGTFDVDERCIEVGVAVLAETARCALSDAGHPRSGTTDLSSFSAQQET